MFLASLVLTAYGMDTKEPFSLYKSEFAYDGNFYQMAEQAPCFVGYKKEKREDGLKYVSWYRYTMHAPINKTYKESQLSNSILEGTSKVVRFCVTRYTPKNKKNKNRDSKDKKYFEDLEKSKKRALNSALSASGRYSVRVRKNDIYIINIDTGYRVPVQKYEYTDFSRTFFCANDYLVQFSYTENGENQYMVNIWSIDGKKCASIPNIKMAGSGLSAFGYSMLHNQKQFMAWECEKSTEKRKEFQTTLLINCSNGGIVNRWKSDFDDMVIYEPTMLIAGDYGGNKIDICSIKTLEHGFPKKIATLEIPDEDVLLRCWCFNDRGDLLIVGDDNGKIYIFDWKSNQVINYNFGNTYDRESISSLWCPSGDFCYADVGMSSIKVFNLKKIIAMAASKALVQKSNTSHTTSNENNTDTSVINDFSTSFQNNLQISSKDEDKIPELEE